SGQKEGIPCSKRGHWEMVHGPGAKLSGPTQGQDPNPGTSGIDRHQRPSTNSLEIVLKLASTAAPIDAGERSSLRSWTTLGVLACVAARMAPKSKSAVNNAQLCSAAHFRSVESAASADPMSDQWTASNPPWTRKGTHAGARFMSTSNFIRCAQGRFHAR